MVERLRLIVVALLVVTTALLVIGTTIEKDGHDESAERAAPAEHDEEAESEKGHSEAAELEGSHDDEESTILGIDRESTGAIALVAAVSLALAAALWFRPSRPVWIVLALVALAFVVVDVDEVRHQLDESEGGLAALASVVAAGHLAVGVGGVLGARSRP